MTSRALSFLLMLVVILLSLPPAYSQDYPMLHFTSENGLPGNAVHEVYRDRKGILWFGTDKGVARYNGIKFEVFTTFNGLPDNDVSRFCEDLYGRLWLISFNGELCYFKDDTFHTALNTPLLRLPFQPLHVKAISPQKDSSVVIMMSNSTRFLNITANSCHIIETKKISDPSRGGPMIYCRKTTPNRYSITYPNSAVVVDTLMNLKQQFDVDTFSMEPGSSMQLFVSCQNQEYLFNSRHIYTSNMAPVADFPAGFHKSHFLNAIYLSLDHRFYGTNNGLIINDSIQLLKGFNISSISNDRYGNYWISTLNNGVFVLKSDFMLTRLHSSCYDGRVIYSFAHAGQLFFVPQNYNLYNLHDNRIRSLLNLANPGDRRVTAATHAFKVDSNFRFFGIINNDLIYRRNVFDDKTIKRHIENTAGTKSLFYYRGCLFLQQHDAILRLRADTMENRDLIAARTAVGHGDDRVLYMGKDNRDNLWYSTMKSMYTILPSGIVIENEIFRNTPFKAFEFIGEDMLGYTTNNVLLLFVKTANGVRVDTLKQDCIWDGLYKVDAVNILIGTNSLYRLLTLKIEGGQKEYKLSVIDDPFIPLQPEAIASDGSLCHFLKGGSVTTFDKECITSKPPPPRIFFTELRSGENVHKIEDEVKIQYWESKNMTISFSVVSFAGSKVTYQYSITKKDRDYWTEIKGEEISLVNPAYGNYTVKIRAKSTSSYFSRPVEFTLRIARPFWVRWWFILITIVAVIYTIVFLSRKRLMYILKQKDKEHDIKVRFMKSEYKAMNALMNPHFIFNTLNNVQGLINGNDKLAANEYLRVIADLIRQNMHNTSKELITLQKEIDLVSNYLLLEKLRFKEKLNYKIIIDKGLDLSEVMIPPLLIQPLVENSIKHGILPLNSQDGAIYINVFERKGSLCIEIRDNGVGLSHKKADNLAKHESFGLQNIRKRIEQLSIIQGKEILFEIKERPNDAGTGKWTVVSIVIPIDD